MSELPTPDDALDIQHDIDPAPELPDARRIPHLGHALLYLAINLFAIGLCQVVALAVVHGLSTATVTEHPLAAGLGQVIGYVVAIAASFAIFPLVWGRSFPGGMDWNLLAARRNAWKLVLVGLLATGITQLGIRFFPPPDRNDLLNLLTSPSVAWTAILLASVLPPIAEEILFRGFFLPAFAIAYDWLSLERTPASLARWQSSNVRSKPAWVFATVLVSLAFAALHGPEYGWSAGSMSMLFLASIILCVVRIRAQSVAAASLVHIVYNAVPLTVVIFATGGLRHLDKLK